MRPVAWWIALALLAACGRKAPPPAATAPVEEEAKPPTPHVEPPRDAGKDAAGEKLYREAVDAKARARALRTRLGEERTALASSLAAAEGDEREVLRLVHEIAATEVFSGAALLAIDTALERAETLFEDGHHAEARVAFAEAAVDLGALLRRLDLAAPTVRARLDLDNAAVAVTEARAWLERKKLPADLSPADDAVSEGRRLLDAGDLAAAHARATEARAFCEAAKGEGDTLEASIEAARAQRGPAEVALAAWETYAKGAGGERELSRAARAKLEEGDRLLAANDPKGAAAAYEEAALGFEAAIEAGESAEKARVTKLRERDSPPPPPPGIKGDSRVVAAVSGGLDWLARHQDDTGKWDCGAAGVHDPADVYATALSALCFLEAGFLDRGEGPAAYYAANVGEALRFLMSGQSAEGDYCARESDFLAHAAATFVMCEAYRRTKDPALGASAGNAVRVIEQTCDAKHAWLFLLPADGEVRGSAWCARALVSAREAGIDVDVALLQRLRARVEKRTRSSGLVGLDASETPAAITIRILAGEEPLKVPAIRDGLRAMAASLPTTDSIQNLYLGAVATRLASQSYFGRWRATVSPRCQKTQLSSGPDAGSWDPEEGEPRVVATALMTLTLVECSRPPGK